MSDDNTVPESVIAEFYAECDEVLHRVSQLLPKLEVENYPADVIDSIYRDIHTLKGSSQLFGFTTLGMLAHAMEASLEHVRKHKVHVDASYVAFLFKCLNLIEQILKDPKVDYTDSVEKTITKLMSMAVKNFADDIELNPEETYPKNDNEFFYQVNKPNDEIKTTADPVFESKIASADIAKPPIKNPEKNDTTTSLSQNLNSAKQEVKMSTLESSAVAKSRVEEAHQDLNPEASTIRVQVGLLDRLMNLVGEIVLVRNQVIQYSQKNDSTELLNLSKDLDFVTSELQGQVMKTRMQPIGSVLTKFQRVVRDLASDLGKQIDFKVIGADTELDKSLIEAIKDPLTHIIRNSCDHGIERIEDRKKSGKSESGTIMVKSYHESGQVIIEISDDGRGLSPDKIKAKALEKKIITHERANQLTFREIQQLIFAPGFSTAEQVSSVSGRGVGMDVVKTNIEKVGGIVDLESEPGKGSTIKLKIPLTLAIVPAMTIKSNDEIFAIPQIKLVELVSVDMEDGLQKIESLQGQPVYRLRGQLLPLVSLGKILTKRDDHFPKDKKLINIVVLTNEKNYFGLIVDEICDTVDIVVKPIPKFLKSINMYSGSTIMGNGTVALILDVSGLAEKAHLAHGKSENLNTFSIVDNQAQRIKDDSQEFLFFSLNQSGRYCIPLVLVQRLEEFSLSQKFLGKKKLLNIESHYCQLFR